MLTTFRLVTEPPKPKVPFCTIAALVLSLNEPPWPTNTLAAVRLTDTALASVKVTPLFAAVVLT